MSITLPHNRRSSGRLRGAWAAITAQRAPLATGTLPKQQELAVLLNLLSGFKRLILTLLILLGACTLYDQAIGDGQLPRLNDLSAASGLAAQVRGNSTLDMSGNIPENIKNVNEQQGWQNLSTTRGLLTALSPEIAAWLYDLNRQHRIAYREPNRLSAFYGKSSETLVLAAYEKLGGTLYIGDAFWALSDGEKAAILAHEYRHARQNWPKQISHRLAQLATGGQFQYQSELENEAFDYERQARSALGLSPLSANIPR